jgi:PncC family amidohydrolase
MGGPHAIEHSRLAHEALLASGLTVGTAESCTGGLVAAQLTDHAGASAYLLGSVVSYDNRVKREVLGVGAELLDRHGAVSEEVCRAMAAGARRVLGADLGIGVTGIAGPGGGSEAKPVGRVYIGLASAAGVTVERHDFWGDRTAVRRQATLRALEILRRAALDAPGPAGSTRGPGGPITATGS